MDPFLGEIRPFAFGVIPRGWHLCDGTAMQIRQNNALFALIGIVYGGDGVNTFNLPDLRGRVPLCQGVVSNVGTFVAGNANGLEAVALTAAQVPTHSHNVSCSTAAAATNNPAGALPAVAAANTNIYADAAVPAAYMAAGVVATAGQSLAHNNMQPTLAINFCIATEGLWPPRD